MRPSARKDRKELAGLRANAAAVSPARLVARRRRVQGAPAAPQASSNRGSPAWPEESLEQVGAGTSDGVLTVSAFQGSGNRA
jgi:hypothetical protein